MFGFSELAADQHLYIGAVARHSFRELTRTAFSMMYPLVFR
ncbi:MAG TPA: hypothetical protein PLW14_07555 [Chlorobiota bacterium]|nr:hypothetical protein [Chlorobiota bacterium]